MFAPTAALYFFLMILRQLSKPGCRPMEERRPLIVPPETTIATIRIAHILDAPVAARGLLSQVGLDVYLRQPSPLLRYPVDITFSLNPVDQLQRALTLLREINPSATQSLLNFHHDRQKAIRAVEQWWTTGVRVGRVLRSDRPAPTLHDRGCKRRFAAGYAFARELPKLTPAAMLALSMSKSKKEREERIGKILAGRASGCKGCLARLEGVYMPELRSLNANFPASPK